MGQCRKIKWKKLFSQEKCSPRTGVAVQQRPVACSAAERSLACRRLHADAIFGKRCSSSPASSAVHARIVRAFERWKAALSIGIAKFAGIATCLQYIFRAICRLRRVELQRQIKSRDVLCENQHLPCERTTSKRDRLRIGEIMRTNEPLVFKLSRQVVLPELVLCFMFYVLCLPTIIFSPNGLIELKQAVLAGMTRRPSAGITSVVQGIRRPGKPIKSRLISFIMIIKS